MTIIIPALNEGDTISSTLAAIAAGCQKCQVIVADGGSADRTPGQAMAMGASLVTAPRGRASQMNRGAQEAKGDVLMFLHADCLPPEGFQGMALRTLKKPGTVAGAFDIRIRQEGITYRLIERMANLRSRLTRVPYGDQGLFMLKSTFARLGGFEDIPIMEDIEIARRLKSMGRVEFIASTVSVNPRRWLKGGIVRTTLLNLALALAYTVFGVSPRRLARYYRDVR